MRSSGEFISLHSKELVALQQQHKKAEAAVFPQAAGGVTLEAACFVENNMKESQSVLTTTLASPISTIPSVTSECSAVNGALNASQINTSTGQTLLSPVTPGPTAPLNNINFNNLSSILNPPPSSGRLLGSHITEKTAYQLSDSNGSAGTERESPNSSFLIDIDSDESKLSPTGTMPVSLLDPINKLLASAANPPGKRHDDGLKLKLKNPRSKANGRGQEGVVAAKSEASKVASKVSSILNGLTNGTSGTAHTSDMTTENSIDKGKKSRKRPYEKKDKTQRKPVGAKGKGGKAAATAAKTAAAHNGNELDLEPPAKKSKTERQSGTIHNQDASTGTCSMSTFTEPDLIGPLEPGTPVTLEGIVWHESVTKGFVVVNITWRGKTYMGTLMDYAQLEWAPPRHCDSPPSDIDSTRSPIKDKGLKRGRNGVVGLVEGNFPAQLRGGKTRRGANFQTPASPARSDVSASGKRKGRLPSNLKNLPLQLDNNEKTTDLPSPTDESRNKRGRRATSGPLTPSSEHSGPSVSPPLLECPEPNCSKKYKHVNGLRYHQQHQHGQAVEDDQSFDSQPETRSESANAPSHAVPASESSSLSKSDMDSLTAMELPLVSATKPDESKPSPSDVAIPSATSSPSTVPVIEPSSTVSFNPPLKPSQEITAPSAPVGSAPHDEKVDNDTKGDKQRNGGRRKQSRPCSTQQKGAALSGQDDSSRKEQPTQTPVLDMLRGKKPASDILELVRSKELNNAQSKSGTGRHPAPKADGSYDSDSSNSSLTEQDARNLLMAKLDPNVQTAMKSLEIHPFGMNLTPSRDVASPTLKAAIAACQKVGKRIRDNEGRQPSPQKPALTVAKSVPTHLPLDLKITSPAPTSPSVTTLKTQEHPERTESAYSDISDDGDDTKPDKDVDMPSVPSTPVSAASDKTAYFGYFPPSPYLLPGLADGDGKRNSPSEPSKKMMMPFGPFMFGALPPTSTEQPFPFSNILEFPPPSRSADAESKLRSGDSAGEGASGSAVKTSRPVDGKGKESSEIKSDAKCRSPSVKDAAVKVPVEGKSEAVKPKEEVAKATSPVQNKLPPAGPPLYAQPPYLPPPGFRPGMPPTGYPPSHPMGPYMGPRPLFPQDQVLFNMMYGYGMPRGASIPPGLPQMGLPEQLPFEVLQQRLYPPGQFAHKIHELTKDGNKNSTVPSTSAALAASVLSENKKPVGQSQDDMKKGADASASKSNRPAKSAVSDERSVKTNSDKNASRRSTSHSSTASSPVAPIASGAHAVDSHPVFAAQRPPPLHLPSSSSS